MNALPDVETISKYLEYDPHTGDLIWKRRTEEDFKGVTPSYITRYTNSWNTKYAGKSAYATAHTGGSDMRKVLRIKKKMYFAHRIIWKLVTGEDPNCIDHIDGDPLNNRWSNLRSVSHADNMKNMTKRRNSSAEVMGVHKHRLPGKWVARISSGGNQRHLGVFGTFEEAVAARKAAEAEYGFHPNHGRC